MAAPIEYTAAKERWQNEKKLSVNQIDWLFAEMDRLYTRDAASTLNKTAGGRDFFNDLFGGLR